MYFGYSTTFFQANQWWMKVVTILLMISNLNIAYHKKFSFIYISIIFLVNKLNIRKIYFFYPPTSTCNWLLIEIFHTVNKKCECGARAVWTASLIDVGIIQLACIQCCITVCWDFSSSNISVINTYWLKELRETGNLCHTSWLEAKNDESIVTDHEWSIAIDSSFFTSSINTMFSRHSNHTAPCNRGWHDILLFCN